MESRIICLDTSILFDYFRKKKKENSFFLELMVTYDFFEITSITAFEIKYGINPIQFEFWNSLLSEVKVLSFDNEAADIAVRIHQELKKINKQIALPDLFIASIAIRYKRPLATLNRKLFERIQDVKLILP
ncbi:type II toxin-antitoxin system VapC family toxin [Aquiflexum sp.]|uniref:type II toxin-antitoxin system VapC family toxin n=1 Tax=Aquiflexum sp. TaxID=1872584 RepID=UPI0035944A15